MSVLSESYMPQIESLLGDLRAHESSWGQYRDKMNAYKIELDEATRELRKKHGYDAIESGMAGEREAIGKLEDELFRVRCSLVVGTVDLLYRADPSVWTGTRAWLSEGYRLDFSDPRIPGEDCYLDDFHAFALAVREPAYWDDPPKLQENGYVWLYKDKVGMGIHRDLLFDHLRSFLSRSDRQLEALGGAWARSWLSEAEMDREKRRALYEAMKAEFEADPGGGQRLPGWRDDADGYVCRGCGFECNNPNMLPKGPWTCPRCGRDMSKE